MTVTPRFHFGVRRFLRDEDGSVFSIEFCLWVPILLVVIGIILDVSTVMRAQALAYNVASDAARRWVRGELTTTTAVETWSETNATFNGRTPTTTAIDNTDTVTVTISYDMNELEITGTIGFVSGDSLVTMITHWKQN